MTKVLTESLNFIPENISRVHLMGVGGTGMAAMAGLLKKLGFIVSGSDQQVYPPMSHFLAAEGIEVSEGYRPENLIPPPDLVIVGNVIRRENPEAGALMEMAIPYVSLPQALGHFFLQDKTPLVISGTHGKTTTSSILATVLHGLDLDPGFLIGGIVQAFGSNFRIGAGQPFVVEGDEYDTAFFDKGPKFLHYRPWIGVITSIEFDHADIYSSLQEIKNAFQRFIDIIPPEGCLVACLDDPVVRNLAAGASCPVMGYGSDPEFDWSITDIEIGGEGTCFRVLKQNNFYHDFFIKMIGRHNALNSLAVIAVLDRLGVPAESIARQLAVFGGVRRRQEVRGEVDGITVIDDFAHHPTAVRETLESLGRAYEGRPLVVIFEPRTNSSRRAVFQDAYAHVFLRAAEVVIKEPQPLDGLAERELFSAVKLADDLNRQNIKAGCYADTGDIINYLLSSLRTGDVAVILSNGGFDDIHDRLLAALRGRKS